jgi:hypothetical protein
VFPAKILYGAHPNLQLSIGTTLAADPRFIDNRPKVGDLQVSGLYNFDIWRAMACRTSSGEPPWTEWASAPPCWLL